MKITPNTHKNESQLITMGESICQIWAKQKVNSVRLKFNIVQSKDLGPPVQSDQSSLCDELDSLAHLDSRLIRLDRCTLLMISESYWTQS